MSKRLAFLAAASPLAVPVLGLATPVQAQDYGHAVAEEVIATYSEPVVQALDEGAAGAGAGHALDDLADEPEAGAWRDVPQEQRGPQPRRLAYSPEERAEWLSQCRALHADPVAPVYLAPGEDADGGLIGGLLGAVAGGGIGNEVTERHSLAGTLIGAGLGGLAGAMIGSVIDKADDDSRRVPAAPQTPAFGYCEAYLLNYERGHGTPQLAYAPMILVPVAQAQARPGQGARRVIVVDSEIDDAP